MPGLNFAVTAGVLMAMKLLLRRHTVAHGAIGIYSITVDVCWKREKLQIAGLVLDINRS